MPAIRVTVLAFDPGKSTGIAFFRAFRGTDGKYYSTEYGSETMGPEEHHLALSEFIAGEAAAADEIHIVLERFDFRNGKNNINMQARDYIGIIDLETRKLEQRKPGPLIFTNRQMPSHGKGFVQNENLQKMGLWKSKRHEMDAYRHLFWYMIHKADILRVEFLKAGWR